MVALGILKLWLLECLLEFLRNSHFNFFILFDIPHYYFLLSNICPLKLPSEYIMGLNFIVLQCNAWHTIPCAKNIVLLSNSLQSSSSGIAPYIGCISFSN